MVEESVSTASDEAPYQIQTSSQLGRYLIATRDIEPNEILISEFPLLTIPADPSRSNKIERCLGCSQEIDRAETTQIRCILCFFPVCSPACEQVPHHRDNECQFFRSHKVNYPIPFEEVLYKSIMVLRAFLLRTSNPIAWTQLMQMESHYELRLQKPSSVNLDEKVIQNVTFFYNGHDMPRVSEIRRICGIIDVNAHLLPYTTSGHFCGEGVCYVFPKTSLLSHSCVPNAAWAVSTESDSKLVTRASIRILKGTEISVSYDVGELLYGTLRRVIPMEISGLFTCHCRRCIDPTELGTHISTLICQKCSGYVLPVKPTDSFSDWVCQECEFISSDEEILDVLETLETKIGFPRKNILFSCEDDPISELEGFVKKYSGNLLHPCHYILQEIKLRWIKQITEEFDTMLPQEIQSQFLPACQEFLTLLDLIIPGISETRAIVQFHYCQGLSELIQTADEEYAEEYRTLIRNLSEPTMEYFLANFGFQKYTVQLEKILKRI